MEIGIRGAAALAVIIVAVVAVAWLLSSSRGSITGQIAADQPAQTQIAQNPPQSVNDIRLQICTDRSSGLAGQQKADYINTCMSYLYKLCTDNNQCGPFSCVSSKCQ